MAHYVDPVDGSTYSLDEPRWQSETGRTLWIEPGEGISPAQIDTGVRSIWRYAAALPVTIPSPISLGEGLTPLRETPWDNTSVLFKLDFLNPTGSFKDRGTSVMLSYLASHNITTILEDSSGNGGSSVAGYGAAGGLNVTIFVPATTSPSKISQVKAYGASIELVPGPREESQYAAIMQATGDAFYASHNWQAFFLQGTKTLAYEIWEDLGFNAPENVIVPVGAGSSLLGCWLGFTELVRAGQIDRMPRLFAAQPLNCSPVDAAFQAGADADVERPVSPTIAEGTSIAKPLRLKEILHALHDTHGRSIAVTEEQIQNALVNLCSRGLFVEPTSATAAAAFQAAIDQGHIGRSDTTVVLLTGSGLKAASAVEGLVSEGRAARA